MPTYHRILVATDLSRTAAAALSAAARIARRDGAELHVLHVRLAVNDIVNTLGPDKGAPQDVLGDHAVRAWIRSAGCDGEVQATRVLSGGLSAAPQIVRYAQEQGIDLIVMGSHGRSGAALAVLGNDAQAVLRQADCSVMVVRPDIQRETLRRILAPVDLSAHSAAAMRRAADIAAQSGAALEVLLAVEPLALPPFIAPVLDSAQNTENARNALAAFVGEAHLPVAARRVLVQGVAHAAIVEHARRQETDLIVMSHAGLSAIERLFLGSVTERVLRTAPCAVLVHREAEHAAVVPAGTARPEGVAAAVQHPT